MWCAIIVYTVFAVKYCTKRTSGVTCNDVNVIVRDSSQFRFMTPASINSMLAYSGIKAKGELLEDINTREIERVLRSRVYIKSARAYTSVDGKLNIEIEQREPVIRIQSANGYNVYITDDNHVMPITGSFFANVPIITGNPSLPFATNYSGDIFAEENAEKFSEKSYNFIHNLINFVSFLKKDDFWGAQIVQINIIQGDQMELIPRTGDAVILLGDIDGFRGKLDKLMKFYKKGLAYEGWDKYKYIDLRFDGQVICRAG